MSESADRVGKHRALFKNHDFTDRENMLVDALYMVAFGSMDHGDGPDLVMCRMIASEALDQVGEHVPADMKVYRN